MQDTRLAPASLQQSADEQFHRSVTMPLMTRSQKHAVLTTCIVLALELSVSQAAISADAVPTTVQACQGLRDKTFRLHLDETQSAQDKESANILVLDGMTVVAERHRLNAYTSSPDPDDIVSVKQMDGGEVTGIFRDKGLGIIAIGRRTSYRVKIQLVAGKAQFYDRQELPTLYRDRCNFTAQFFGACQITSTSFSRELRMAFTSGYDRFGFRRSYAFGADATTPVKELTTPQKGPAYYFYDVPGSGGAAFRDHVGPPLGNFYFFDGNAFVQCG